MHTFVNFPPQMVSTGSCRYLFACSTLCWDHLVYQAWWYQLLLHATICNIIKEIFFTMWAITVPWIFSKPRVTIRLPERSCTCLRELVYLLHVYFWINWFFKDAITKYAFTNNKKINTNEVIANACSDQGEITLAQFMINFSKET